MSGTRILSRFVMIVALFTLAGCVAYPAYGPAPYYGDTYVAVPVGGYYGGYGGYRGGYHGGYNRR